MATNNRLKKKKKVVRDLKGPPKPQEGNVADMKIDVIPGNTDVVMIKMLSRIERLLAKVVFNTQKDPKE